MAGKKLHILLILTGGTIGTCVSEDGKRRIAPENGAADPLLFQLIRKKRPELQMDVEVKVPYQVLSEHMNLDYMNRLGECLRESRISDYDGVLITHGSDTLAFTAAFLGELLRGCPVPVFLLASQRPLEDPESNGLENSLASLEMIRSGWYTQRDPEEVKRSSVYVPYRNSDGVMYLHRASELRQCEPGTDDFFSEGMRAVPQISVEGGNEPEHRSSDSEERSTAERQSCTWQVPEVHLTPDVLLIRPYVGIRYDSISLSGIRAVLHTLYHSSTAPKELTGFLNRCKAEGVTCYILPCDEGAYHYETTTELLRGGAIPLSGMTEEKAYMCLLMKKDGLFGGKRMDIEKIISEMSLEEKAAMVSGRGSWWTKNYPELGVPEVQVSDGPHGVRKMYPIAEGVADGTIVSVCFPAACATASSFDTEMMEEMGSILGKECQAENVAVLLGPAVNIKRSPLCGRNFEYLSEDPYLAGKMSASYIRGVQKEGVGTSIKHFAANNQEFERMYGDSVADERTLREIYLPAFETAVKESDPWTVMCSYNRVNGTYASENHWLLTEVLRDEWGYTGAVMSDWGAVSNRIAGLMAGLDLEMPDSGGTNDLRIIKAVQDGTLPEEKLDEAVRNVLGFVKKAVEAHREEVFDREADHQKAVEIAKDCIVLLKNEGNVLPLSKEDKVAVIGGFAKTPRYQGGGSSHIKSFKVDSFLEAVDKEGFAVKYAEGFPADKDEISEERFSEALSAAEGADKIIVFAGLPDLFESEGYDREHMRLPISQNQLIEKLITLGKPVIVVLHNGSPVEMPWADSVSGIVESYLAGEGVGEAQRDILYGVTNPSGKLAETFPVKLSDNPSFLNFPGMGHKVNYAEGVFTGYRYYDTKQMAVRFPFGFGLSYTEFRYSNMRVSRDHFTAAEGVTVSVDVTNIGEREGKEVVQLYVSDETKTAIRPVHELKGFVKLSLKPGETKTATFTLGMRSFAWYDEEIADWYASNGTYKIEVGSSSRDIKYSAEVNIIGSKEKPPVITPDVQLGDLMSSSFTRDYTQEKLHEKFARFEANSSNSEVETPEMVEAMIRFMPLRALRSFLGMSNEEIDTFCEGLKEHIKSQM